MAICTQQADVIAVGFPVTEAATPCPASFGLLDFSGLVNVVDIERPEIGKSAKRTLAAERLDDFHFTAPIARVLVDDRAVLVPISSRASRIAKLGMAWFAAMSALSRRGPSSRNITGSAAVFSRAITDAVRVHFLRRSTVSADDCYRGRSHKNCISNYSIYSKPKYFDIACRRIQAALDAPSLFDEPKPPAPQQTKLAL